MTEPLGMPSRDKKTKDRKAEFQISADALKQPERKNVPTKAWTPDSSENKRIRSEVTPKILKGGVLAAQSASFGTLDNLYGGAGGLFAGFNAMMRGEDISEATSEGYKKSKDSANLSLDKIRDELGGDNRFLPMLFDIGGAMTPGGGPAKLAQVFSGSGKTGSLGSRSAEVGRQALGGSADALVTTILSDALQDGTFSERAVELGIPAAIGMVAGGGSQLLLGEVLPAFVKYGLLRAGPDERIADRLFNTGPDKTGMTPDNLRDNYPLIREGQSFIEADVGTTTRAVIATRVADALAEAQGVVNKKSLGGAHPTQIDEYAKTLATVQRIGEEGTTKFRRTLSDTLGIGDSKYARNLSRKATLDPLRARYARMSSTDVPGKGGDISFKYQKLVDNLNNRVASKMKYGKVTDIGGYEQQYLAEVENLIRPRAVRTNTKGVYTPASGVPKPDGTMNPNEIDLSTAHAKMVDLVRARKAMADKLKPGVMIDGTTQTKERAAAALSVMSSIDDIIASRTFGNNKVLNKQFSQMLKIDESHKMGKEFYSQRMVEDPTFGKNLKEYMSGLDDDARDGFKAGYKEAMMEGIERNGARAEFTSFAGDTDAATINQINNAKQGNIDNLRAVLGDTQADAFLKDVQEGSAFLDAAERIRSVLEDKGASPKAVNSIIRDMDDLMVAGAVTPGQASLLSNAGIGAISRRVKALKPADAERLQRLVNAKGEFGIAEMDRFINRAEITSEFPAGNIGGGVGMSANLDKREDEEGFGGRLLRMMGIGN